MWSFVVFMLIALGVVLIPQIIYLFVLTGDADDAVDRGSSALARLPFNKRLHAKMKYYPWVESRPVGYLVVYMNLFLPMGTLLAAHTVVSNALNPEYIWTASGYAHIAFTFASLLNAFTIRAIDDAAFIINMVYLASFLANALIGAGAAIFLNAMVSAIYVVPNVVYFIKRKRLFFTSEVMLKREAAQYINA